jgi:hypothetical protein
MAITNFSSSLPANERRPVFVRTAAQYQVFHLITILISASSIDKTALFTNFSDVGFMSVPTS